MTGEELRRERRLSIPAAICGLLVPACLFGVIGVSAEAGSGGGQAPRTPIEVAKRQSQFTIDTASDSLLRIGGVNGRPSADLGATTEIVPLTEEVNEVNGFDVSSTGARTAWLVTGAEARPLILSDGSLGESVPLAVEGGVEGLALEQTARPTATDDDPEATRPPPAKGFLLDRDNRILGVSFPQGTVGEPIAVSGLGEGERLVAIAGGDDGSALLAFGVDEAGDGRIHRVDTSDGAATDPRADGQPVTEGLAPDGVFGIDLDLDSGTIRLVGSERHLTIEESGAGAVREHQPPGAEDVSATALLSVIEPNQAVLPTEYEEYVATGDTWLLANLLRVVAMLFVIPLALFLWDASRRRRPVPTAVAGLAVIGAIFFGLPSLVAHFAYTDLTNAFLASGPQTWPRAVEFGEAEAFRIAAALERFAAIPLALWVAWGSYEAMEAGLLPRFIGLLGLVTAIPLIVFPLPGVILATIWIASVSLIVLGLWAGGRPPAWAAGRAVLPDIDPRYTKETPRK